MGNFGNVYSTLEYYWLNFEYLSESGMFRYNVMIIILQFMSYYVPALYAFLTIDILRQSKTTLKILKAVGHNANAMFFTAFFGLVIIYLYITAAFDAL